VRALPASLRVPKANGSLRSGKTRRAFPDTRLRTVSARSTWTPSEEAVLPLLPGTQAVSVATAGQFHLASSVRTGDLAGPAEDTATTATTTQLTGLAATRASRPSRTPITNRPFFYEYVHERRNRSDRDVGSVIVSPATSRKNRCGELAKHLTAVKVDLKAVHGQFYGGVRRHSSAVLDTLRRHSTGMALEWVLLIPA